MEAHGQSGGQSWTRGNCWETANAASSILQICEVPLFPMSQGSRRRLCRCRRLLRHLRLSDHRIIINELGGLEARCLRERRYFEQEDERIKDFSAAVGVEDISARKVFCNDDGCLDRIDNELVSDGVHLTTAGSGYSITQIAPLLSGPGTLPALEPAQ
jgi:hypothetical protein